MKIVKKLLYRLAGILTGLLTLLGCSKGIIVSKWAEPPAYEPRVNVQFETSLARQAHFNQAKTIDDADYCIGYYYKRDTLTLYLPYAMWRTSRVGDTLNLRPRYYSDWYVNE